jgi:MFS family permease
LATRALLILACLNLLDYLDRYLIASLGSLVKGEMGLSDRAFGFLGTAFFLVYFLSSPIFGYLGDRFGRVRLMAGGALLWSLATSLTFWVVSYPTLVLARGLVGVGEASFGTLAPAYLADILPLNRRSRALGFFYLAIPVGSALAYLVGGLVGSKWGWRPAFLVAGIPGMLLAALVLRLPVVGRGGQGEDHRRDACASPSPNPPPPTPHSGLEGKFEGSAGELGSPSPPRNHLISLWAGARDLWRLPTLKRVTLGYGMVTFTLGGLAFWMPRYLEASKGLEMAQANYLLFGTVTVAGALGTLAGGFLGDRLLKYTPKAPLLVSGVGVALSIPLVAVVIFAVNPVFYIPGLVGAIFLLFLNPGVLTAVVVNVAGPGRRAQAVALNIVVIHLVGDVPSPFLIGWIADLWSLKWGVSLTLVTLVAGAILILKAMPYLSQDLQAAGELQD